MISFMIGALGVVFAFGLVIFVHEFGHFIVAKKTGVKVDRFAFGLGPEMFGFQWGETRYCVAWIPLGGEVRMAGEMEPGAEPKADRDPREFFAKPWYKRVPIVLAGPAMNYVLAFGLFALVFFAYGNPRLSTDPMIGELADGFPARTAGLEPGDRVVAVDGAGVSTWASLAEKIHASPGKSLALTVDRSAGDARQTLTIAVIPRRDPVSGRGMIGVTPTTVFDPVGAVESLRLGGQQTVYWSLHTLDYLKERLVRREKPELSGPVGIASVISKSARSGLQDYIFLIAMISLGIGLFNLFPIPMLDGGHLMFFLYEGIFRRPAGRRVVVAANMVGLSVLLGILVFATYSDIQRLRSARSEPTPVATGEAK
jgi:regulator of sigma E protease